MASENPPTRRPTLVGGGERRRDVRSTREGPFAARPQVRVRRADRAAGDRDRIRSSLPARCARRAAHDTVVHCARDRGASAPALRPAALSFRRSGRVLAAGRRDLVRRRTAGHVHDQRLRPGDGRLVPAREPAQRRGGADGPGHRGRRRRDRGLQQARALGQRARLHPAPVRHLLARGVCRARAGRAGPDGGAARGPGRTGAGRGREDRGGGGACADRARAPRHRRPRRQRDGAPGRRGQAQAPRRARRGPRRAQQRRAGRAHGAGRDAPTAGRHAPRRGRRSTWYPSPASTPSAPCWTRSAGPACLSGCTSTASRSRSRRRSTCRPTGSFRRA